MRIAFSLIILAALAATAHAQNKAAAAAAFDKGKELMDAGNAAEACPEFERSQELDPQFGTQYNLALCYQAVGKLASAYGEFDELSSKDTNAKRKKKAKDLAAALKKRLTYLTLVVNDPAPQLVVKRDDEDITLLVGVTTPVDPGEFRFEATAPGRETWSQKVDLTAEGATITVEVPVLAPVATDDDGSGDVVEDDGGGDVVEDDDGGAPPAVARKGGGGGSSRKLIGMVTAGAGVLVTGGGLFFGFQAKTATDDAKSACGGSLNPCSGDVVEAQEDIDDARKKAMLSNIFVGVGVAALAAGLVIWLTAPDDAADERRAVLVPVIGEDGGGLVLDGRW